MEIYKEIFNATSIYDMLFINVTGVLEYPSLSVMLKENESMYNAWVNTSRGDNSEEYYLKTAIDYPEFTRIIAISYGSFHFDNGLQRTFKRIVNENEYLLLATLFDDLNINANSEKPKTIICGDNIISNDIPLLIKRFLLHKDKFDSKTLPDILKKHLMAKSWDSFVIDTRMIWKFNSLLGLPINTLELFSNFLSLKKTVDIMKTSEISEYYWNNIENNESAVHSTIQSQSSTKVNLVMQLVNLLREL